MALTSQPDLADLVGWAHELEFVVLDLTPELQEVLRQARGRVKTLVVGADRRDLCDFCPGARVSDLLRETWPGDLIVGHHLGSVRALMPNQATGGFSIKQGATEDSEIQVALRQLSYHRNRSRLAAGSPTRVTVSEALPSFADFSVEDIRVLEQLDSYYAPINWLRRKLGGLGGRENDPANGVPSEFQISPGSLLYWALVGHGPWTLKLGDTAARDLEAWRPSCLFSVGPHKDAELIFGVTPEHTFLLYRGQRILPGGRLAKTMPVIPLQSSTGQSKVRIVGELGHPEFARRLADFIAQWDFDELSKREGDYGGDAVPDFFLEGDLDDVDLNKAIEGLPDGGSILIGRANIRLRGEFYIRKPLTLLGLKEGGSNIQCLGGSDYFGVNFEGQGPWRVRNLNITAPYDQGVIGTLEGTLECVGCKIGGGKELGIQFGGDSQGYVENCVITSTELGILVNGTAAVTLLRNVCSGGLHGIQFDEESRGLATENTCCQNKYSGICVGGSAQPTLKGNRCEANGSGILFVETSGGFVGGNVVTDNKWGIDIGSLASPQIEVNKVKANRRKDNIKRTLPGVIQWH